MTSSVTRPIRRHPHGQAVDPRDARARSPRAPAELELGPGIFQVEGFQSLFRYDERRAARRLRHPGRPARRPGFEDRTRLHLVQSVARRASSATLTSRPDAVRRLQAVPGGGPGSRILPRPSSSSVSASGLVRRAAAATGTRLRARGRRPQPVARGLRVPAPGQRVTPADGTAAAPNGDIRIRMYDVGFGDCFLVGFPSADHRGASCSSTVASISRARAAIRYPDVIGRYEREATSVVRPPPDRHRRGDPSPPGPRVRVRGPGCMGRRRGRRSLAPVDRGPRRRGRPDDPQPPVEAAGAPVRPSSTARKVVSGRRRKGIVDKTSATRTPRRWPRSIGVSPVGRRATSCPRCQRTHRTRTGPIARTCRREGPHPWAAAQPGSGPRHEPARGRSVPASGSTAASASRGRWRRCRRSGRASVEPDDYLSRIAPASGLEFTKIEVDQFVATAQTDALALAVSLEKAVNGTSLMLAFECGDQMLLFPGDAQWGTWDRAIADPAKKRLLAATTFLKVGHHGSHNATPRRYVEQILSDTVVAAFVSVAPTGIKSWSQHPAAAAAADARQALRCPDPQRPLRPEPHAQPGTPAGRAEPWTGGPVDRARGFRRLVKAERDVLTVELPRPKPTAGGLHTDLPLA